MLTGSQYLFQAPNHYIFQGAEVYSNSEDETSSSCDSEESCCSDEGLEGEEDEEEEECEREEEEEGHADAEHTHTTAQEEPDEAQQKNSLRDTLPENQNPESIKASSPSNSSAAGNVLDTTDL